MVFAHDYQLGAAAVAFTALLLLLVAAPQRADATICGRCKICCKIGEGALERQAGSLICHARTDPTCPYATGKYKCRYFCQPQYEKADDERRGLPGAATAAR